MTLTPIDIQKMAFRKKLFGLDPDEVESFLQATAEELTASLAELEKLERENRYYKQRLQESQERESQLQATLVQVQKVSEQITSNAQQEGALLIREAEYRANQIVSRAMEDAAHIEGKISELRMARRELLLKFRHTLVFFERILDSETEEENKGAEIRTLTRSRATAEATSPAPLSSETPKRDHG